ncbi:hypothetical protein RM543_12115 [Roseicyclus sp. F158]|uniref:Uncharacterized protein n=1 Tax=Tropicimonas omnivorans TaxID=3075590 RepID=A0ABU3DIA2_9RHOB|nr:hypothetical protein [Roseicyclus sp. F158]MDT0683434.1 hypothetical protein [Roseicyclus sp. F158]
MATEDFQVYELYSEPGKSIRIFTDVDEILAEFEVPHEGGNRRHAIDLNLWVHGSGPRPQTNRFALDPAKSHGHTWRERCGAAGFIQLYLERPVEENLHYCTTNTFSEARLGANDGIRTGRGGEIWNVRHTNRFSGKLNRMIKAKAIAKISSVPVLPGAATLWEEGYCFYNHWSKATTPDAYRLS